MNPTRFYVMEPLDGDEVLVKDCATLADAREAVLAHATTLTDPAVELSVWQSNGPILLLWDRARGFTTPPVRRHGT